MLRCEKILHKERRASIQRHVLQRNGMSPRPLSVSLCPTSRSDTRCSLFDKERRRPLGCHCIIMVNTFPCNMYHFLGVFVILSTGGSLAASNGPDSVQRVKYTWKIHTVASVSKSVSLFQHWRFRLSENSLLKVPLRNEKGSSFRPLLPPSSPRPPSDPSSFAPLFLRHSSVPPFMSHLLRVTPYPLTDDDSPCQQLFL
jgi:hypothetical protein